MTRPHSSRVGVVPDITWGQPRAVVDREVALLEEAGVKWIRANANWAYLEPSKGRYDQGLLTEYDYAVTRARQAGIKVLMLVGGHDVPGWASGSSDRRQPPRDMADYGRFTHYVVEHFKGAVKDFEIWNEPNLTTFWSPEPDAKRYAEMLKAAYPAAKEANPEANVILGGLSRNDFVYLEQVYEAGGGDYFDAVAVHPYCFKESPYARWYGRDDWGPMQKGDPDRISWNCFPGIEEIRASMVANGDRKKRVWATEFGWSVTVAGIDGVSEANQAQYLTEAYEYAERFSWLKALFWYTARDNPFYKEDHWEARTGLVTVDFDPRPSYDALKAYAGA